MLDSPHHPAATPLACASRAPKPCCTRSRALLLPPLSSSPCHEQHSPAMCTAPPQDDYIASLDAELAGEGGGEGGDVAPGGSAQSTPAKKP